MKQKHSSQMQSIRKKLMAATSMLLVAAIMMVSSTYAWFTLSTAPEVTGITTTVGANGSLEIALASGETWADSTKITSAVGDSSATAGQTVEKANITWGNLVDLSSASYGLSQIQLLPAELNVDSNGVVQTAALSTPSYGSDGRVSAVSANTMTGVYSVDKKAFTANTDTLANYGVRAIGTVSGMTDRQIAFRNAKSDIASHTGTAKGAVRDALGKNGSVLADVIVDKALVGDPQITETQMAALGSLLAGVESSLESMAAALDASLLAYVASAANTSTDLEYEVEAGILAKPENSVVKNMNVSEESVTVTIEGIDIPTLDAGFINAAVGYDKVNKAYTTAKTAYDSAVDSHMAGEKYEWSEVSGILTGMIETGNASINGIPASRLTDPDQKDAAINDLVQAYARDQGLIVQLPSGCGMFADISDICGEYSASVVVSKVSAGGLSLTDVPAKMTTVIAEPNKALKPYLEKALTAAQALTAPAGSVAADASITDEYGYILDFFFRTNAAESDLLLQIDAAQRVYKDSTNELTQGGGSYMAFQATVPSFGVEAMKGLMKAINIVFMDGTSKVIAYGKLDVPAGDMESTDEGYKVPLALYTQTTATTDICTCENFTDVLDKTASEEGVAGTDGKCDVCGYTETGVTTTTWAKASDSVLIKSMAQNTATKLSVLVYLDGNQVSNKDVANAATSMTGKLNLQFASSATLAPMENTDLRGTPSETTQECVHVDALTNGTETETPDGKCDKCGETTPSV